MTVFLTGYDIVTGLFGAEHPLLRAALLVAVWAVPITAWVSVVGLFSIWLERKVAAHIQCRVGPMEVGPHGALQTLADGLKLLTKEDLVPAAADRSLFALAPMLAFAGVIVSFAVVPFSERLILADLNIGLFFLVAVGSLEAIGIIMAGWASNNKWSLFGAMRAATQVVSYEIPLAIALVTVAVLAGSLSLVDMVHAQKGWVFDWFLFRNPFVWVAFLTYFTASLAECKRAPFDLPEAESELVSGFHTEYSGMRFAIFFLAEYAQMYVVSAVAVVAFLGGWHTGIRPLDNVGGTLGDLIGAATMILKSFALIFVQMWLRWTFPRIRLDQVMFLCLKVLLPFSIAVLLLSSLWEGIFPSAEWQRIFGPAFFALGIGALVVVVRRAVRSSRRLTEAS